LPAAPGAGGERQPDGRLPVSGHRVVGGRIRLAVDLLHRRVENPAPQIDEPAAGVLNRHLLPVVFHLEGVAVGGPAPLDHG
jgi:hypothetical protein